jgi:K+-sensing histidine kinase KdpD
MDTVSQDLQPAEVGLVMLWDPAAGFFRSAAAFGYKADKISQFVPREGESITGKVFNSGKPLLLTSREKVAEAMSNLQSGNLSALERSLGRSPLPISTLAVPITAGNQKFGVFVLEVVQRPNVFSQDDIAFVQSLADLLAITIDRLRLADQLSNNEQVREIDRMRSEVMAILSHELRMPLTSIKGYSTALMLEDVNWEPEKNQEFLHLIDAEVDSMQSMIKDILDSALIDVGQMKLELQPLRLQHIARAVAGEIQRYSEIHHILCDFPVDFPIVEGDPRWIKQVFRNVLENALKYSPDGGLIVIRGEVRPSDVVVRVADQGIGISPEDLIPLFEKYFRVRSTERLHVSGTGLGLPVARSIIEAHGGRIWAESQIDCGTTVYFSLPKAELMDEEDDCHDAKIPVDCAQKQQRNGFIVQPDE